MKKDQKLRLSYKKIKQRYGQLKESSGSSRVRHLWHQDAAIRDQIKRLQELPPHLFPDYPALRSDYIKLLDSVSERLLTQYNQRNHTNYSFQEAVASNPSGYLKSGIISVLVSSHIPQMVSAQFRRLLPKNPAEEYPLARSLNREFYLHLGDTNTGKTYQALQRLKAAHSGVYLAPLRILALENYERLNREGVPCSLLTGEEEFIVEGAKHLCCTVEKAKLRQTYDVAVIDEVQLVSDSQRGDAWSKAIFGLRCLEIHLCGAKLVKDQLLNMIRDCGDTFVLKEYTRLVPLEVEPGPVRLSAVMPGDALVAFSKRSVLRLSQYFTKLGIRNSVIYGDLPPEVRKLQYQSFIEGTNPILVATDAIGMGINLPIRRLIFTEVEKFDGENFRPLTTQEVKQIAGRAGRIGIYPVGYVACLDDQIHFIAEQLSSEDEPIDQAVIGPSEVILEIPLLTLREKLALWSIEPEALPHYRKKDIRNFIVILDVLKEYKLPEAMEWRLMNIPFDVNNQILLSQFIDYVGECFVAQRNELSKPITFCRTCADYEVYYQQVNLYYSFSKALDLPLDDVWVMEKRREISEQIDQILQKGF
ncbi:MAG: putative helicase [Evtepia sp.]|jgi:ATP-dependent RNA helicase SUPV3L1/SUV3|nr:putative helicase [Evtepia sp.]